MSLLEDVLKILGVLPTGKSRGGSIFPTPPDPGKIRENVEKIVEGLSELKEVPKTVIDKIVEADEDFRGADKSFRGTRLKGKKE